MMRRIVDASLPVGCLVAILPAATYQQALPTSLQLTLGNFWGHAWAACLAISMLLVIVGICLRNPHPGPAYILENPACIFAGIITTIYGVAIWSRFGLESWIAIFFVFAIGLHFVARFAELTYARAVVARRPQ